MHLRICARHTRQETARRVRATRIARRGLRAVALRGLLAVAVMVVFQGCIATKGYPGPERPDNELALLGIDYDRMSVATGQARANNIEFGSAGIKLLPGTHSYTVDVGVKEAPENCHSYPSMDYGGYEQCRRKRRRSCNCFDFVSVYRRCERRVKDGNCGGKFVGKAGGQYDVVIRRDKPFSAEATVVERGTAHRAGQGSCDIYGSERTETEDEYLGSGRNTAWRYRIYSCY